MSLLNFFTPKNGQSMAPITDKLQIREDLVQSESNYPADNAKPAPEIPENIFVEYAKPKSKQNIEPEESKPEVKDLNALYRYLGQNLEKKGYEDALINPDSSSMEEYVQYISNELSLLISKIKTYYSGYLRTIDFHIDTRTRNGLIETVEELLTHKATVQEEIKIVASIEEDSKSGVGLSQNLILGYKRGFRNGFSAITYNQVLGRRD